MNKWLRLGLVLLMGASAGRAVDWKARYPHPEGYLSDFARVIDPAARSQIEAYGAATGARRAGGDDPVTASDGGSDSSANCESASFAPPGARKVDASLAAVRLAP